MNLAEGTAKQARPGLSQAKLAWLRKAAKAYLAESDDLDARIDALDSAKRTPWDSQFLADAFYPASYEGDPAVHFDPRAWLWAWLYEKRWYKFRDQLRSKLSARDMDELVSWGNGVIDPQWSLSTAW